MTPLFACFPVCMTLCGIALVGVFAVALIGLNKDGPNAPADAPESDTPQESDLPKWWLVVVIFGVVFLHFAILLWLWPEL